MRGLKSPNLYVWLASVLGVGMFGYSLTQQTAIQLQMNQTMDHVAVSLAATPPLVAQTAQALAPLTATTSALANIDRQEQQTVTDLTRMNEHLANIGASEKGIVRGLDHLNQATSSLTLQLQTVSSTNAQLLDENSIAANLGVKEANQVGDLSTQTNTSIEQLKRLNDKLSALSALP